MRVAALLAAVVVVAIGGGVAKPATAPLRDSSTNWSGYAVEGASFASVKASWVQPAANCLARTTNETDASFWVGLGGNSTSRRGKVEQIGTDSDCASDGEDYYYAWYELWPADAVNLALIVSAGDRMSASVTVHGTHVVLQLRNLTTKRSAVRSLRMKAPDTTSAEWIAEAPSLAIRKGSQLAAMTNFGSIQFVGATVSSTSGHTGTITDKAWHASAIEFESEQHGSRASAVTKFFDLATAARGVPSPLWGSGSAFSVQWTKGHATRKAAPPGSA